MAQDRVGKEGVMQGIRWETDFLAALGKAGDEGRPVYQDFWFDG